LADSGGICISATVHDQVKSKLALSYEDLGEQSVKNIAKPVRVFCVGAEAETSPAAPPTRSLLRVALTLAAVVVVGVVVAAGWRMLAERRGEPFAGDISAPIRSIAVLPLENLSGDPEQEYFADGMTEALIGDLAKIRALRVISRTSVMQYKGERRPLREIAQELDVDGVVEGTVMRAGDRVRITVQLIDARHDSHLWSDRYDRGLSDVLALHSEVAWAVAEQIRLELTPEETATLTARRSIDPRAYDAHLRGLQLMGPAVLAEAWGPPAIEQLEKAVKLDANFAEGYVALAMTRALLGVGASDVRDSGEFQKAREAAKKALELDDRLGSAHAVLASVHLFHDWDFPRTLRACQRALQLSPSDPYALSAYAMYLLSVEQRVEEGLEVSERLLRVAPLDLSRRSARIWHFLLARQYKRGLEETERMQAMAPGFTGGPELGATYALLGRFEEAYRAYASFFERCGAPCESQLESWKRGWAEGGLEGAERRLLETITQIEGFSPFIIAMNYTRIGEVNEALAWLERGYQERDPKMVGLKAFPGFDPLRSDPRFQDLLRRIGFPEDS
jgi:TolB-like protein